MTDPVHNHQCRCIPTPLEERLAEIRRRAREARRPLAELRKRAMCQRDRRPIIHEEERR